MQVLSMELQCESMRAILGVLCRLPGGTGLLESLPGRWSLPLALSASDILTTAVCQLSQSSLSLQYSSDIEYSEGIYDARSYIYHIRKF